VSSIVDALNSFLERKHVNFAVGGRGLRILDSESGEPLEANALSSGEKQIVLLFSDIVALQDQARVFIIDEPELSLNPRWQRQVMPALLALTQGSGMQILAATHSIEIMAKYHARLRHLDG
jgi:ABC-type glutathione transport system ATPase component